MIGKHISATGERPTALDLFCGCGGVTAGLQSANFEVVAAVDNDAVACLTYRENHPTIDLIEEDISNISLSNLRDSSTRDQSLDLMVVCAPCQPFSSQQREMRRDPRLELVLQSVRFAMFLRPRVILFENVAGMASSRFSGLRRRLHASLSYLGYNLSTPKRLDAADFGVPQRRVRLIMLATLSQRLPSLPDPRRTSWSGTVRRAIGDLRPLKSGEADPDDCLHFARRHRAIVLERLRHIPKDGGSRFSLPVPLQLACHRNYSGFPDVYGRMKWDAVAPTLTTGCTDLTRGRFVHPRDDRALTLREAARLQTFPDRYKFIGSAKDIATQIGNAVPVSFMHQLAWSIRSQLSD